MDAQEERNFQLLVKSIEEDVAEELIAKHRRDYVAAVNARLAEAGFVGYDW